MPTTRKIENAPANPRLVIVAAVVALAAVVLVNVYISMVRAAAQPGSFTVFRLNAAVHPGQKLREGDVTAVRVDQRFAKAFKNAIKANAQGQPYRLGTRFERSAQMNDLLTYNLFEPREQNRLDLSIAPGHRGVALAVNSQKLPGDLQPGMYVDIQAPFSAPSGQDVVLPVMERVKVLLVGSQSQASGQSDPGNTPAGSYSTITIEVTPKQALQLAQIQRLAAGSFQVDLRNPGDQSTPDIPGGGINPAVLKRLGNAGSES